MLRFFLILFMMATAVPADESDYFPLQVGNTWTYRFLPPQTPETLTVAIVDTQRVNGNLFYLFNEPRMPYIGGKLLRKDSRGDLVEYNPMTQQECLRFRLTGEIFEKWNDCDGGDWIVAPEEWAGEIPENNFNFKGRSTWIISCDCFGPGMRFIDGLGIINTWAEISGFSLLVDAVISGKPFPLSSDTLIRKDGWGMVKALF